MDDNNEVLLALGSKELTVYGGEICESFDVFDRPAHWTHMVRAEKRAGVMVDEFPCSCGTHTEDFLTAN